MTPDLEPLIASIDASLADIAEKLELAGGIESGLADLIETMRERKGIDLGPLVAALKSLNPTIQINVPPAPAPVVHILPATKGRWEITRPGGYGQPEQVLAVVTRTA